MSDGRTIAIVPVKGLGQAKSRLSPRLDENGRRRLVLAMLTDVLGALRGCKGLACTWVVTPDPDVAAHARSHDASTLMEDETSDSLNGALRLAIDQACRDGATQVLIVPGDVPEATSAEFAALLTTAERTGAAVTIASSHDGRGTNALLLKPPRAMAPAFGLNSCQRHLANARTQGLSRRIVELAGLGRDVDEPSDLDRLHELTRYSWLKDHIRAGTAAGAAHRVMRAVNEGKT